MASKKLKIIFAVLVLIVLIIILVFSSFGTRDSKIYIDSVPQAKVFINTKEVGTTPYEGQNVPGKVIVKLVSVDGSFPDYQTEVNLSAGVKTVIRRNFGATDQESSGEIVSFESGSLFQASMAIVTFPDSASLSLDEKAVGLAPLKLTNLQKRNYKLAISSQGYKTSELTVTPQDGYLLTAIIKLAKITDQNSPTILPEVQIPKVKILTTSTGFLRAHEDPSLGSREVGRAIPGQLYDFVAKDAKSSWLKIKLSENLEGWVTNQYTEFQSP